MINASSSLASSMETNPFINPSQTGNEEPASQFCSLSLIIQQSESSTGVSKLQAANAVNAENRWQEVDEISPLLHHHNFKFYPGKKLP